MVQLWRGLNINLGKKFFSGRQIILKAIGTERLYTEALSNCAFARLRKYEFKDSRMLSKGNGFAVLAGKNKVEIPSEEQEMICADLKAGYALGDKKGMIVDAIKNYCE